MPSITTTSSTEPTTLTALRAAQAANETKLASLNSKIAVTESLINELYAKTEQLLDFQRQAAAGNISGPYLESLARQHQTATQHLAEAVKGLGLLNGNVAQLTTEIIQTLGDIRKFQVENDIRQRAREEELRREQGVGRRAQSLRRTVLKKTLAQGQALEAPQVRPLRER
ncbi:hypothetical protein HDU96_006738 [Phlyctochytrium bullatum]|nr:hypothetical protein HDU96_006738 [Phlyctochytrium bullatum]